MHGQAQTFHRRAKSARRSLAMSEVLLLSTTTLGNSHWPANRPWTRADEHHSLSNKTHAQGRVTANRRRPLGEQVRQTAVACLADDDGHSQQLRFDSGLPLGQGIGHHSRPQTTAAVLLARVTALLRRVPSRVMRASLGHLLGACVTNRAHRALVTLGSLWQADRGPCTERATQ